MRVRNILHDFFSSISFDIHMLMLVFMFLHIVIPQPIVTLITPFANANTFCTMAMIGLMMEVPDSRKDRVELAKVIGWRLTFSVIIAIGWSLATSLHKTTPTRFAGAPPRQRGRINVA